MNESLIIVVTGASSGIGSAIARHLAADGHAVYGTSRSAQDQSSFSWLQVDVMDWDSITKAINQVVEKHGHIDVLINNAGIGMISSLEEAPFENIDQVIDTNFNGLLRMIKAILPQMRERRSGKIINISSIAGLMGLPYRSIYSASKFAVEGLTEALRTEVKKFGVQVCTLQPGSINTNIKEKRVSHLPKDSVYNPELMEAEKLMNEEVANGIEADAVAEEVARLISTKRLRSKYVVARPFQKTVTLLKRWLPPSVFERLLMNHYKLGG
ncbi:MAG: SDR family oxidoreductase [Saprospiraceae bacterium]|nr:SDR family oxidoreductase [Saprospiraceae bacterium]